MRRCNMPFGDGSGPGGMGSRTGRGFGYCTGYPHPGFTMGRGFMRGTGRGFGRGFHRGFGYLAGYGPYAPYGHPEPGGTAPEHEKEYLKNHISSIENTIDSLKKRLDEIDKEK